MNEVDCQICKATAGGLADAVHEFDTLPDGFAEIGLDQLHLLLIRVLVQEQIEDMVDGLNSGTTGCSRRCNSRKLVEYSLTGKGPKFPTSGQLLSDLDSVSTEMGKDD